MSAPLEQYLFPGRNGRYSVVAMSRQELTTARQFFLARLAEGLLLVEGALPEGDCRDQIEVLFTNQFVAGQRFDDFVQLYPGDYFIYFFLNDHAVRLCQAVDPGLRMLGTITSAELPPFGIGLFIAPAHGERQDSP